MSLAEKLDKIKSPKLSNQRETAVVLSAVEDTLKDQHHDRTPTAYFVALLALLGQAVPSSNAIVNKDLATSVVYLIDIIIPYVPAPLLRSKFPQILTSLAPALAHQDVEAPLLRSSIGCLECLLLAQDTAAWTISQTDIGPRKALAGLLSLSIDHRPKVRKRAQEALSRILKNPPPSPSLDHPAADLCAETALQSLSNIAVTAGKNKKKRGHGQEDHHHPGLLHALQLVKTIALASGGWPSKKIDSLCEVLLNIAKSTNEYLTMATFEVFEIIFIGMAEAGSSSKLPRLMEVISELRPSENDSQLLPPWIAVISRGYDVSAQLEPEETFHKLPELFDMISAFLTSASHNIRISASECLISFTANCVPDSVILEPSVYDEKVLEKLGRIASNLLGVKYQSAWMEVFNVVSALFESLRWKSVPVLNDVVKTVGELRGNESFNGKKEADTVLGKAVEAMGPEAVLGILPLNLLKPLTGHPGRAWLLPILRDHVRNTNLQHFRTEFVPLSEAIFQRVIDNGDSEKTMTVKIFETLVQQIWSLLPGFCSLPLDLISSFDQGFAELIANLLYTQTELRPDVCKALQHLVESNKAILAIESPEDVILLQRTTKADAQRNLDHLALFSGNLLAVLFNVYSQTLPHFRGYILQCINSYLSITPEKELMETFTRVATMLEAALKDSASQAQADKQRQQSSDKMPPTSHTLMDLVITLSIYLPRSSFPTIFSLAALVFPLNTDPQLQKKAYKLLPRLAASPVGLQALQDRNTELQQLLLTTASSASSPCRRDRLAAIAVVVENLPPSHLHFIPSVLSEVVISTKEVNERARTQAFDLLVLMARKLQTGGTIAQSQIPHMPPEAPDAKASLEEFCTMVSAGLGGVTPHMVSASITSLTRILFEFRQELEESMMGELVRTMDEFLEDRNREVVRSVLGFVKVAVISLPDEVIKPRLESLLPKLMGWSKEHKARFRSKVKNILERMIRRFGSELVEKWCPEEDRKLVANIRKTRERRKKQKKKGSAEADDGESEQEAGKRKGRFESEFENAVYGSEDDTSDSEIVTGGGGGGGDGGQSRSTANPRPGGKNAPHTFIVEDDDDEPLDLLDRKALGNISSTKPVRARNLQGRKQVGKNAKVDVDGKLVINGDSDDDDDDSGGVDLDVAAQEGKKKKKKKKKSGDDAAEGGGVGAYVDAIRGRDAVQRGRGGRLKFSNRREKDAGGGDDEMEVDDGGGGGERGTTTSRADGTRAVGGGGGKEGSARLKSGRGGSGSGRGGTGRTGRLGGGVKKMKMQRRGLGVEKVRGGRVAKRGGGGRR